MIFIDIKLDLSNQIKTLSDRQNENSESERIQDCGLKGGVYFQLTRKCYVESSQKENNSDVARAECKKIGGDLATIANQETQDFYEKHFSKFDTFIGAERIAGVWSWVDGTPWTGYVKWASGEPNKNAADTAVVVISSDTNWWDVSKSFSGYYLCQI